MLLEECTCPVCSDPLYHDDLEKMLDAYSAGKYVITDYGQNVCVVKNTETNESFNMPARKIVQEIRRPTPSPILPVDQDKRQEYIPVSEWDRGYQTLVEYKEKYGTASVLKSAMYKGYPLGLWCQRQRDAKSAGRLKKSRQKKLDEIGFVWGPRDSAWDEWYELFKHYVNQTGDPYIPSKTAFEGEKLGAWVESQRKFYKAGKLSKERAEQLLKLNPDIFKTEWEKNFDLYARYINETGNFYVMNHTVYEGKSLGAWVHTQIRHYRQGKLSDKKKAKLLELNPQIFD